MTLESAQRWLGIYFLTTTVLIGCYLLLSTQSLLPLDATSKGDCFKIIIPVFIGQLTIIFQWIANANNPIDKNVISPIPGWAIQLPPFLAILIVLLAGISLVMTKEPSNNATTSSETFKNAITFSVTILNATTVYLVPRLFPSGARLISGQVFNFSVPEGWTFEQAAHAISIAAQKPVKLNGFKSSQKSSPLHRGEYTGVTAKEALEKLKALSIDEFPDYSVDYSKDVYTIDIKNT
ncbi:hypothetical protein CLV51_104109 [Chitinophaga niastensis]|uniref:Uncharacterized protein n=1 Tax=Chitinophaga niastensis TaxID=536980 RepID=A0A2P8HGR3_CHINA|nr:hypothetical protein [Chitinophaga niastensis]PSL45407.1 hypothetical protein CLV51_104109 [Chitinophaga niastensis]